MSRSRWLLLTHQIPSEPSNLRVKVWRRLQAIGAVSIKNSIYVLPNLPGTREDFDWLQKEIGQMKGDASVFLADNLTDSEEKEIIKSFRQTRGKDFDLLVASMEKLSEHIKGALAGGHVKADSLDRLEKAWTAQKLEWDRLQRIDFFRAANREKASAAVKSAERLFRRAKALSVPNAPPPPPPVDARSLKGRVWVTRGSPHIDRIASAWLVRRFVDANARFKFVAEPYKPKKGELRFDMREGEFTHFGDWCTFETLIHRLRLTEPALQEMGEIIHDIDLKDRKFGRSESHGVSEIIRGLCRRFEDDNERLRQGFVIFDSLYAAQRKED